MPKRKRLFMLISCLFGLAILICVGPIIIASIMKMISNKQPPLESSQNEPTKSEIEVPPPKDLFRPEKPETMLMVSGEIAVIKDGDLSYVVLTAKSGKKYILVGPKAEELIDISGRGATVAGVPKKPILQEIKGDPIRMTIEVKTVEIK